MSDTYNPSENDCPFPEIYEREKLDAMYRAIPLEDTTARTLRRYFTAMANLYGIITLHKAYEIIASQSPTLATRAEFLAFAEIARHERDAFEILGADELFVDGEPVEMMGKWIIDPFLLLEDEPGLFLNTQLMQEGKPYYVPDKRELLRYEDDRYFEQTPQLTAMRAFLANELELDEDTLNDVIVELLVNGRYAFFGFDLMKMLHYFDVGFVDEEEMGRFMWLYQELHNHVRMQGNCGFTPIELARGNAAVMSAAEMGDPSGETRQAVKPAKVGRNDPCPCGSGKKYKKCCGR